MDQRYFEVSSGPTMPELHATASAIAKYSHSHSHICQIRGGKGVLLTSIKITSAGISGYLFISHKRE